MGRPPIRDSRIPCPNCKKSTLFWNSEEKIYVCTLCGIQEPALETWISSGVYRQQKKKNRRVKERQWALDILGVKDKLNQTKLSDAEQQWDEIKRLIEEKNKKVNYSLKNKKNKLKKAKRV
ncbi:hypothetical protein [Candidatus Hodarchaeum mangrovi]